MENKELNQENLSSTLQDSETMWTKTVRDYLFEEDTYKRDPMLTYPYNWKKNGYVTSYREYNDKTRSQNGDLPGQLRINDMFFSIPPESISVSIQNRSIDIPQIRSKHSVKLESGYGEVSVSMQLTFATNPIYEDRTIDNEIRYKLIPLLTQLRHMPFAHVENEYIRKQLVEKASEVMKEEFTAEEMKEISKNIENDPNIDIMLTYVSHSFATNEESPEIIKLNLEFLVFNYLPYMNRMQYVSKYNRKDNKFLLDRDPEYDMPILPSSSPTGSPEDSEAFYEFHATEFMDIERRANDSGHILPEYKHLESYEKINFKYFTYLQVEGDLLTKYQKESALGYKDLDSYVSPSTTAAINPLSNSKLPCAGPISSHFGQRKHPKTGKDDFHKGIDISAVINTPVYTLFDGEVTEAGWESDQNHSKGYGKRIYIRHENGVETIYAHLYKFAVHAGQIVKAGELIGYTGNTGSSSGPHLHYQVILNGEPKNPLGSDYRYKLDEPTDTDIENAIQEYKDIFKENNTPPSSPTRRNDRFAFLEESAINPGPLSPTNEQGYFNLPSRGGNHQQPHKDNKDIARHVRTNIRKIKLQGFLDQLPKDSWSLVTTNPNQNIYYIKIQNIYSLPLNLLNGFHIGSVESQGGHDIPRIPISGFKYATHQFLGGHVEKLALEISVNDDLGHEIWGNIQRIFNEVSNNAILYKDIASLDGLGIENSFINCVQGGTHFVVDDVVTRTHPEIPGGSLIRITFTDYTKVKEHAKDYFGFKFENQRHEDLIYKQVIRKAFEVVDIYAELDHYKLSKPSSVKYNADDEVTYFKGGKVMAEDGYSRFKLNYSKARLNSRRYSSLTTRTAGNTMQRNPFPREGSLPDELVDALIDLLDNHIVPNEWNDMIISDLTKPDEYIYDPYNVKNLIDWSKFDDINIHYMMADFDNPVKIIKTNHHRFFSSEKGDPTMNQMLIKWATQYLHTLIKYLPDIRDVYTEDVIAQFEIISTPAYNDFNLPPTINPDYYFYQNQKFYGDLTKEEMRKHAGLGKDMAQKYKTKYLDQFKNSRFGDQDASQSTIVDKIIGEEKEVNIMTGQIDDEGNFKSRKIEVDEIGFAEAKHQGGDIVDAMATNAIKDWDVEFADDKIVYKASNNKTPVINAERQSIYYAPSHNDFLEKLFIAHAEKNSFVTQQYDMMRCFPVFKIYFVEEDDQETFAPLRKDLNDLYGLNAVQEIRYVDHADQPASLLTVRFVDLSGKFTSAKYKEKPGIETKEIDKRDTELENPLDGIMVKEGTRVRFLAGYSNDVNKLENVFSGQITAVDGKGTDYSMVCQSYGVEFVQDIKFSNDWGDPTDLNAETKEILNWCLLQDEVKHFGRWKLNDLSNLQFSGSTSGAQFLWYDKRRADGKAQKVWSWTKDPQDMNILAPEEDECAGLQKHWESFTESPIGNTLGLLKVWEWWKIFSDTWFSGYGIYRKTLWEVIDDMTYRYPGYVAKVLPWGDRCTLYYGPPESPYFYRPLTMKEKLGQTKFNRKYGEELEVAANKLDELNKYSKYMGPSYDNVYHQSAKTREYRKYYKKLLKEISPMLPEYYKLVAESQSNKIKSTRTFRRYWSATSENNIIYNRIKADYRDVYTKVHITHSDADGPDGHDWQDGTITMNMNDFMQDQDLRGQAFDAPNANNEHGAYRYGGHWLWRQAKKLYKGHLNLLGEPGMKPYDYIIVMDDHTQTYGPVEVREHVLSIAPGEGMISSITPGMVSSINDMVTMSMLDAVGEYYSKYRGERWLEGAVAGTFPVVGSFVAAKSLGSALSGLGVFGTFTVGSLPILAATAIVTISLATKIVQLAKNREPILLSPLTRGGVPYVVGMNTYKIGSLIEYYENEWKLFNEGLDSFSTVLSTAIDEMFNGP